MEMKMETECEKKARLAILELAHMMSVPMSLVAAIKLKVPDAIWQDGSNIPLSAAEILGHLRPNGGGSAENLQRILRMLTSYDIFAETRSESGERKYSLTYIGKTLVTHTQGLSYAPYVLQHHQEELMRAWELVGEAVDDPAINPFKKANGEETSSYYKGRSDATNLYSKAMYGMSVPIMTHVLDQFDGFQGIQTLVDVGGNSGVCLRMIMSKYPIPKGINYDLPHAVAYAPPIPGVTHVGGDAIDYIPHGDAIFMKWMLVGWSDEECKKVLQNCYEALPLNGKVIACEPVLSELTDDSQKTRALLGSDIYVMATLKTKAKLRTEKQFKELAISAGFHRFCAHYIDSYFTVLEFFKSL